MTHDRLLSGLFPGGHSVLREGDLLVGPARTPAGEVAVIGICGGAEVGVETALALAAAVLDVIRRRPACPILSLVDTRGQRMSRRDEILGLSGYLAHLAACVELARRRGHRILALVHGEAVSGGFLPLGLMADEIHAVEGARISVMNLPAMARVTKIPLERLEELSRASPVLAPGVENYSTLGCVESMWRPPLAEALAAALARPAAPDRRSATGLARGGRRLAHPVALEVSGEDGDGR